MRGISIWSGGKGINPLLKYLTENVKNVSILFYTPCVSYIYFIFTFMSSTRFVTL